MREVFHSDTLHETPLIQRKDHADSCYKNMPSVRKCIQIQMGWLHFKHAPQQSTDCCVWPSNRPLSPCNNCWKPSQNLSSDRVGIGACLEQAWLKCCLHISWLTQISPSPLLLGYSTFTPRKSPVSGKGAITLDFQFPPELILLPSMVGLLVSQNWKGNSKTKWEKAEKQPWNKNMTSFFKMNHLSFFHIQDG